MVQCKAITARGQQCKLHQSVRVAGLCYVHAKLQLTGSRVMTIPPATAVTEITVVPRETTPLALPLPPAGQPPLVAGAECMVCYSTAGVNACSTNPAHFVCEQCLRIHIVEARGLGDQVMCIYDPSEGCRGRYPDPLIERLGGAPLAPPPPPPASAPVAPVNATEMIWREFAEATCNSSIQRCPKCKLAYVKVEYCNKITCPRRDCGTRFCNLCKTVITPRTAPGGQVSWYYHFQGHGDTTSQCPLYGGEELLTRMAEQRMNDAVDAIVTKYSSKYPTEVGICLDRMYTTPVAPKVQKDGCEGCQCVLL